MTARKRPARKAAQRRIERLEQRVVDAEASARFNLEEAGRFADLLVSASRWTVYCVRAVSPDGIEMALSQGQIVGRDCALCHAAIGAHSPAFDLATTREGSTIVVLLRCPRESTVVDSALSGGPDSSDPKRAVRGGLGEEH